MAKLPVEKGKQYQITINSLGSSGEGVGRIDGFTVFVEGGLPQEELSVKITEVKKSYATGKLVRIIKASPDRVEPACAIYQKCGELSLPIIFHAGIDPISPREVHCTPQAAAFILDKFPDTTMIMAHLGGNGLWDEVESILAGRFGNLYMDTALTGTFVDEEQLFRIIRKHGADKILFASDCPWDSPRKTIDKLRRIGLYPEEEPAIFSGNARALLGLQ